MFLRNYWYVAAWDHEVGQEPLARTILDEPVVMYRTGDGSAVAFEDRCCHRHAPLSFGRVTGDNLQCGYHGMIYAPDGTVIGIPGQTRIPPGSKVRTYPLVERWRFLWIWMGDPAQADESEIPELHWHDDPAWTMVSGYLHVGAHYQLLVDNLLDLTHETFLHASTIGNEHVANTPLAKVERDTMDGVRGTALERVSRDIPSVTATRWMHAIDPPPFYARSGGFDKTREKVDRWQIIRFEPPSHVWLDVGVALAGSGAPEGDRSRGVTHTVIDALTPETAGSTHYFWTFPRNHQLEDSDLSDYFKKGVDKTFLEDKWMLEGQQRRIDANPDSPFIDINADAGGVAARNIVARLLEEEQRGRAAGELLQA